MKNPTHITLKRHRAAMDEMSKLHQNNTSLVAAREYERGKQDELKRQRAQYEARLEENRVRALESLARIAEAIARVQSERTF